MKPNKGSGQKSLKSKISHEKKMLRSGVKNSGINQSNDQSFGKRALGQDGAMNADDEDLKFGKQR